jgi:uncharacterized membrane protein
MYALYAFLVGFVSGLRTFTAPAVVAWAAHLGHLSLSGTPLAFMGSIYAAVILTVLAVLELVADQLPKTPSRKSPPGFIARILSGSLVGACVGAAAGFLVEGLSVGLIGAVAGTYGGYAARLRLAQMFGKDLPAALVEDVCAILLATLAVLPG